MPHPYSITESGVHATPYLIAFVEIGVFPVLIWDVHSTILAPRVVQHPPRASLHGLHIQGPVLKGKQVSIGL